MEAGFERESSSTEVYVLTDPDVLFDKMFSKIRKQMDKNIKQQQDLQQRYALLSSQWNALLQRRVENDVNS